MSELAEVQEAPDDSIILKMTAEVVASYVGNNPISHEQLPDLITSVHRSFQSVEQPQAAEPEEPKKPAVSIRKSITPEFLICLEDGKKLKMLKRHLRTTYSLTPEEYRAKWNLPSDYPMVAPNYAAQRSQFAKKIGLGRRPEVKTTRRRRATK